MILEPVQRSLDGSETGNKLSVYPSQRKRDLLGRFQKPVERTVTVIHNTRLSAADTLTNRDEIRVLNSHFSSFLGSKLN
jgi:hypothetical protein